MSKETEKCNDQPASERSCPDPAGSKWARLDLDTERAGYTELWIQGAMMNLEWMRKHLESGNDDAAAQDMRKVKYSLREALGSLNGSSCTVPTKTSLF